jgi:hypothetical protein
MSKRKFIIPIVWTLGANLEIEAESLDEAILMADSCDLPKDGEYINGSFEVNKDVIPFLNEKVLTAEEKADFPFSFDSEE